MGSTVLLTGATGLLGTWLRRTAPPDIALVALTHRAALDSGTTTVSADLRDGDATDDAVAQAAPTLVLHAAYALDEASIVDATRHVADGAARAGADLVLISTDAVFSGDGRERAEGEAPDPVADYGRWKSEAEALASASPGAATIVRLPLLVSLDPEDHVTGRIRRSAAGGEATTWFHDELRQPAYASEIAAALWQIVGLGPSDRQGWWHLPGPELLSRFEIAGRTARALGLDPALIHPQATPAGAERPRSLVLGDDRARRTIGWAPTPVLHRDQGGT